MAIAAVPAAESRLCGNCKKDIPAVNFIIHEIHCRRNIEICPYCSDSIPKSEMKNHIESEHVQVTCKCRMKMESSLLKEHEASSCPLRPVLCQFCDIQLAFSKLQEHELYCGARTEPCGRCGRHVLLRELPEHPRVCGTRETPERAAKDSATAPASRSEGGATGNRRGAGDELERPEILHSQLAEDWNADLDYVLALSLQSENNPHHNTAADIPRDFWEYDYTKEPEQSAHLGGTDLSNIFTSDSPGSFSTSNHSKIDKEMIMLPCEFCEELCPAEDLILHQTGCNPASAFASFSKRSSSPNPWEYSGLQAGGANSHRTVPSSQPQAVQAEGDIMIPCEFCGIQLEEEILFHHQHHCDLRPASPTGDTAARELPAQPHGDRRESPEPARRRIRHQGDVSPWHAEGSGKLGLCPAAGTRLRTEVAKAGSAALSPPGRAGDAPAARGKPRKGSGSEGTRKDRGDSAAGTAPRARPAQHFQAETFTSSSSRASPAQPSSGAAGGGRSLGLSDGRSGLRRRSSKAKGQSPAAGHPEE
ncbi:TRAF-type zinc finger domain-containing protein 1 isoform X2 [Haemorhous mexicanus]|uniref:TRAF-type zinc finger domain-containing protein 1 isoform X2 n=1 Tax=Haemorhous mexicanus TaxID=30427 RepID=UPI0028BF036E|nr:TRAF-type zinc finger domain-containing protein 1 isoform X2 [Haemorhous mexicanus]